MESATSTDIEDLFKLLKEPSNKIKFRTLYMDVYTMYSVIQLIDIITGSEPIDFTPEKAGIISDMKELLNSFAAKYLQNKNGLNPDQPMLYEILVQKTTKWDIKLKRHPRHDTIFSSSLTAQQSDSDEDM